MNEIKRRTGGVIDALKPRAPKTIKAFANEHHFPDADEMEKRLVKARMSVHIFRDVAPSYKKREVLAHFKKLKNGLSKLLLNLELEPFFSSLALGQSSTSREKLIQHLRNSLHTVDALEKRVKDGAAALPNSIDGAGRPNQTEMRYLNELKCIHKLTGFDSWVTHDPYAEDTKKAFSGPFFDFAKACYKLDKYEVSDGALAKRIQTLRKLLAKNNNQNP